jgi:hypothetical protein
VIVAAGAVEVIIAIAAKQQVFVCFGAKGDIAGQSPVNIVVTFLAQQNVVAVETADNVVEIAADEEVVAVNAVESAIDRIRVRNRTDRG